MRYRVPYGTPHPPEKHDDLRYLLRYDPTEPMVLSPEGGLLVSTVLDDDLPEVWARAATGWFMARARYVALPSSTMTPHDVWHLNAIGDAHPDWFTEEDLTWVRAQLPAALVAAAVDSSYVSETTVDR